jgi:hypothetical protein
MAQSQRQNNARRNKHDRQNMKRAEAKRRANPSDRRKFPNKDSVHPVIPGKKGQTSNDPRDPAQTGDAATTDMRRRQTRRS